ncbi:hypothetical protein GCM10009096_31790 [Parasphingorhabdus litoris]|uniref:Uncharacterized protein n=1 Tax=Parasphingorhabdus litoris TaxID=394733 RepID=A0ABN1AYP3_9SPHN|nr:hypothetical protein [Parasphingorhabdus litoris]
MNYRYRYFATVACIASFTAMLMPQTAKANPVAAVDLPALVSDEDLDKLRGGFVVNGLGVNFGADIRTYVNGELLLQTVLNLNDDGAHTTQTAAAGLSPVDVSSLQNGVLSTGNIRMKVGDTPVYLLNNGQTAIVHETSNGVQNMLINTASGFEAVQEVDATLNLSGYENFNSELMMDRIGSALDSLAGQAGIGALGN